MLHILGLNCCALASLPWDTETSPGGAESLENLVSIRPAPVSAEGNEWAPQEVAQQPNGKDLAWGYCEPAHQSNGISPILQITEPN